MFSKQSTQYSWDTRSRALALGREGAPQGGAPDPQAGHHSHSRKRKHRVNKRVYIQFTKPVREPTRPRPNQKAKDKMEKNLQRREPL